tara:strand:- start:381 stop:554 length:174 start_codon:yes stop_codon:yes gene_type:complete
MHIPQEAFALITTESGLKFNLFLSFSCPKDPSGINSNNRIIFSKLNFFQNLLILINL